MNENTSLIAFKAICNFVNCASDVFGKSNHSLKLYKRLLYKTKISHTQAISRHISLFTTFCTENREAIAEKDSSKLVNCKISYSQRIYIEIDRLFSKADKDDEAIIWQHILTISAIVDPFGKAKDVLKKNVASGNVEEPEAKFLANIMEKVEGTIDPNANPMEAVSSIMQSGIFNDLISSMQGSNGGQLDFTKLLGTVQTMIESMSDKTGDDPQTQQAMSMLSNMTQMVGNMQNNGQAPDMMSLMSTLMNSQGTPPSEKK